MKASNTAPQPSPQAAQQQTRYYSISDLAREFGITTRSIRFYGETGLLNPRRMGQSRIYSEADRVKLMLILRGKRLGFSLAESREIIAMYDPSEGNARQLNALLDKVKERRKAINRQLADIQALQTELDAAEQRCLAALTRKIQ